MKQNDFYSDKLLELKHNHILFRNYYFPTFSDKTVELKDINKIEIRKPTLLNGKFRIWGTGDFLHWFPLDFKRSTRNIIFILFRKNKRIRISFTAEDSDKLKELLKHNISVNEKN